MKKPATEKRLQVEYWTMNRVKPYPKNARAHPPAQVDKIVASIQSVGWTKPIVVDERNEILAGHGAYLAAKQIGMTEIPVIQKKGLTQAQRRAYRLADNRVAEGSTWDEVLLAEEFKALRDMGADLLLTGFDMNEINFSLEPPPGPTQEPPALELAKAAVSRPGDLWLLGEHRLICGDSTKPATLEALMQGQQAQCVFTDPPYGVSYEARSGNFEVIKGDDMRRGQLANMLHGAFAAAIEHTRPDAGWYVWHASATREDFAKALRDVGLVELGTIIWAKPGMVLGWSDYRWAHEPCLYAARQGVRPAFHGDRTETTVWRVAAVSGRGEPHAAIGSGVLLTTEAGHEIYVQGAAPKGRKIRHVHVGDKPVLLSVAGGAGDDVWEVGRDNGHGKEGSIHPTMKPVELARRAIRNSTQEGEGVLDMFAGGASTLIAAEQLKRVGYGVELDPVYVDAGLRRWQQMTGKQATHATERKTFDAIAKARASRKAEAKARKA